MPPPSSMQTLCEAINKEPAIPTTDAFRLWRERRPESTNKGWPHRGHAIAARGSADPQFRQTGVAAMNLPEGWTHGQPISRLWSGPWWPASLPSEQLDRRHEDHEREPGEDDDLDPHVR